MARSAPLLVGFLLAGPALAAGGTHLVDDYGVETAGVCNAEILGTRYARATTRGVANLNCTFLALPAIEWQLSLAHLAKVGGRETQIGPGFKWNLRAPGAGPGLAFAAQTKLGLETGRVDLLFLNLPLSLALSDTLFVNLNAGWVHERLAEPADAAKLGAQLIAVAGVDWVLMAETVTLVGQFTGAQAGARWTPGAGRIDVDVTLGHRIDGASDLSVSGGVIVRF
jgi:hypothetical protein